MDPVIQLRFRYTEQDYVRAMRAHYASRLRLKLDALVIVASASLGIYLWQFPEQRAWAMVLVTLSSVLVLMLVVAFAVIPKLVFRREPKFRDEYSLTFSPEGIHFHTAHVDSQLQWSMYGRALVNAHSFILYTGGYSFSVIPKHVFESAEQLAAFEGLIREKIPEGSSKLS